MTGSRRGGAGQPVCSHRRSLAHSASSELSTADADSLRVPRRLTVSAFFSHYPLLTVPRHTALIQPLRYDYLPAPPLPIMITPER